MNLRMVILLAGHVGHSPLADGIGRSVLDLPVSSGRTVLDVWIERLDELATHLSHSRLPVQVSVAGSAPLPTIASEVRGSLRVSALRDQGEYRGTAGAVKDLVRGFDPDDRILVAAAHQVRRQSLLGDFEALARNGEGVSIVPHAGGDFAGLFLLRCARFSRVPDVGFVDLKEQTIPSSVENDPLTLTRMAAGSTLPVRTLSEYVHALRRFHAKTAGSGGPGEPLDEYAETWRPVFTIVEPGAHVSPDAVVQDSVVLAGGRVEDGAAVARSVVCSGGVVRRGRCIVETLVNQE